MPHEIPAFAADNLGERCRFVLRLAALYASRGGTISELATRLGRSPSYLLSLHRGGPPMSPSLAIELENLVGREVLTREMARPDIFVVQGGGKDRQQVELAGGS